MPRRAGLLSVLSVLLAGFPALCLAGTPDPEPFFERLESIGLKTETLRKLNAKIHLRYREPSDTKEAQYSFLTRRLYLPTALKEKESDRVRFDLAVSDIDTVIHEYTHAYDFLMAKPSAPKGSGEYLHWEARNAVKSDLFLEPKEHLLGLPRYPGGKAIEVAGYFMGDAVMGLFQAVDQIESFNVRLAAQTILQAGDAARYGDRLVLPEKSAANPYLRGIANRKLGAVKMDGNAVFEGKAIRWPQDRAWVKQQMYDHALGLHPPRTMEELVDRLNAADNDWIRELRGRLRTARSAVEAKLVRPTSGAPDDADVRNR